MGTLVNAPYWRRNLSPKFIWLESEHFEEAKQISTYSFEQADHWKIYLNALALVGFKQWLIEKTPDINISQDNYSIIRQDTTNISDVVCSFKLGDFNLCLITVDHLIDDFVKLPEKFIKSPEFVVHFYVLLEVLEEEEKLNIYGFLRHDEIVRYSQSLNLTTEDDGFYLLMLNWFDHELNNLLLSARFLEATAISLPSTVKINHTQNAGSKNLIKLSEWLSGVFTEGWQSTEVIWKMLPINLDIGFARSMNKLNSYEVSGIKLFDFGLLINGENFALVVNQKREENNEQDILVQVFPSDKQYLPHGLKLKVTLNPNTSDSESQEVTARKADNAIQLEFSESLGKQFKVEVSFNNAVVTEEFVL